VLRAYKRTIELTLGNVYQAMQEGDRALEIGCHCGVTTELMHLAAGALHIYVVVVCHSVL